MISESVTVQISSGLETRPIAMLVQVASRFQSSIQLECDSRKVNAKSIMGMMSLGMTNGDEVEVSAEGEDEEAALNGVVGFLLGDK